MSKYIYIEWPVSRGLISARVLPPSPIGETAVQRPSQVENYSRQGVFDVDTHLVHHFWQAGNNQIFVSLSSAVQLGRSKS
jgi:hypothetical protein